MTVATAGAGSAAAVIAVGAAKGAAVGMLSGAASGAALGAVGHRLSTGSWDGARAAALDGMGTGALSGAISGAVTGGVKRVLNVSKAAKISTGRTQPNSLNEQIAMKAVKSNPKPELFYHSQIPRIKEKRKYDSNRRYPGLGNSYDG